MRKLNFLCIVLFLLAVSCSKENILDVYDDDGVIISKESLWKSSLHASNNFNSFAFFDNAIIYKSNILVPATDEHGKQLVIFLNKSNGAIIWQWNDIFANTLANYNISGFCIIGNLLTWQIGARSYCINLESGSTMWKIFREKNLSYEIDSYKNNFLIYGPIIGESGYEEYIAFKGNIQTGELTEFLRSNLSGEFVAPTSEIGTIGGISYINEIQEGDLLLVTYSEPLPEWKNKMMFGLYDVEQSIWIYEREQLVEPHWNAGVQHTPIVFNERIYAAAGNTIVCHEVMTGNQKWRRDFPNDFLFSGFIIEDGMLIALCEDGKLYRLNPETGGVVWTGEGAGTSSRMSYMNGVVYFVGGSTGKLHAVDAYTGETVWRLDAELIEGSNAEFRTNAVYVIPGEGNEKGKVVALTHMHAYCFEAYR